MTTAHNHAPRCCCEPYTYGNTQARRDCPLCPEHGDLAQLAGDPQPATVGGLDRELQRAALDASLTGNGYLLNGKRIPPEDVQIVHRDPQPGECPLCHQPIGREHTDYCRFTGPVSLMPMGNRSHPFAWQSAVIQPATTTSQPDTHARTDYCRTCQRAYTSGPGAECLDPSWHAIEQYRTPGYDGPEGTEWPRSPIQWHQDGPDDAHERWQCSVDTCGIAPTPRTEIRGEAGPEITITTPGHIEPTPPATGTPLLEDCERCGQPLSPVRAHACYPPHDDHPR